MTAKERLELLQGTLDMLILKALDVAPMHGFGISVRIRQMSQEVLQVEQGSLYPALYRLQKRGWIQSTWGDSTPCAERVRIAWSCSSAAVCSSR